MGQVSIGKLCFSYIPARYVFVFLTSLALFLVYAFKGFLGVAIVAMVRHANDSETDYKSECPANDLESSDEMNGDFEWDDYQQAIVLGSFFYGYVCTQIPFGIAVEKLSTKWMFGFSILISALLSLIGPIAAKWGFVPFLLTRLSQGLAQGVILPGMNAMIARWMPKMERSRAVSIVFAGSAIGSVVTLPLTGYLCHEKSLGGWPTIFYVLGATGCVWFVFWSLFVFDTPECHPFITESELKLINEGQGEEKISSKRTIPWKAMLTSHRVYPLIITHFGYNWGYLTILTLMPTYFKQILHMNVKTNGLISSLPYIALAVVSCLASYITDKLRERGISITLLRKVNQSIAFIGTGLCLIGVVLSRCDPTISILFFVIAMGLNGCCYPGFLSNYVDMAPDFAGVLMGFCNSFGNTPGFIAPYVAAMFYSDGQNLKNWGKVFYTCSAVYFFTQIVYLLFTTSELQTWGCNMRTESEGKLCFGYIPARYVFLFLTSCGLFLVYAYKGFLGVAIVAMVRHGDTSQTFGKQCPGNEATNSSSTDGDFDWDDHDQATILGCFFYGYVILQVPAGVLADKFGAKWIFGGSMLITAILSLVGPIAAEWGFVPFLITRVLQGLAQGVILPCMNAMMSRWTPKMERSRAISIIFAGSAIGSVVTLPLTGYLCHQTFLGGWPAIFYVLGILGCVWFVFWSLFVFNTPESHPYISRSEYDLIIKGQGMEKSSQKLVIPWKSMGTSYRLYAMIITHFGQNWGYLTILTLLPTYFTKILHMDIQTNGVLSSLPYLCQALVSILSSYITDKVRERDLIKVSNLRKINNSIAFFGPAVCLIAVVLSKCDTTLSIVFFVIALGLNGCCYPGFNSNYVDMAPDFAGILMGICNSLGNFPGFIAPYAAANFYSKGQTLENWSYVFYICAAVYVFTQTIHILFSTSELQTWGISQSINTQKTIQSVVEEENSIEIRK